MSRPRRRRLRRALKLGLLLLAVGVPTLVLVVVPYALAWLLSRAGTRPMDRELATTPADDGRPYEEVRFAAADGTPLAGWLLPGSGRGLGVVCVHGLFRSRREVLDRAVLLAEAGYDVLALDLRRHGESGGEVITLGYEERLDVEAAVAVLRKRTRASRVATLGVSMGAVAAILAAAETPSVAAVVADSPFVSVEDAVGRHVELLFGLPRRPFGSVLLFFLERRMGFRREELDLVAAVRRLGDRPVLVIAGEKDERMPPETQRRLYEASESPRSRFVVFEGAGHGAAFRTDPERYRKEVLAFLAPLAEEPRPPPRGSGGE